MLRHGRRTPRPAFTPTARSTIHAVNAYDLDLDKANALLDEAGFPMADGKRFDITMDYWLPFPGYKPQAEYIKQALSKVGIDVDRRAHRRISRAGPSVMGTMDFDMISGQRL